MEDTDQSDTIPDPNLVGETANHEAPVPVNPPAAGPQGPPDAAAGAGIPLDSNPADRPSGFDQTSLGNAQPATIDHDTP